MQNRYVGDLGDFGKYALLKTLAGPTATPDHLRLGVLWYLVPDETGNNDGKHTAYLTPTSSNRMRFRACDPVLYDQLASIISNGNRGITAITQSSILPPDTIFHDEPLNYSTNGIAKNQIRETRNNRRQQWTQSSLETLQGTDIVFADPDNGLEPNIEPYHKNANKHAYFTDLGPHILDHGRSILVYHHLARLQNANKQVQTKLAEVKEALGHTPMALVYHRGSPRSFILIPHDNHRHLLERRVKAMLQTPWAMHFELATLK